MSAFEIFKDIAAFTAISGAVLATLAGVAFWLFKLFGEKWLTAKFNERLADYKHAQQRELEKLRFSINALMDRTTKLHQHEFAVLPQVWSLLCDTYSEVVQFTSPLQSYPDLDRMSPVRLAEFLEKSVLAGWQREDLLQEHGKTHAYTKMIFWHNLNRVRTAYGTFQAYLIKNGIFIQPELKAKFKQLSELLWETLLEREFEQEDPRPMVGRSEKAKHLRANGPELLNTIEKDLQERLWNVSLRE